MKEIKVRVNQIGDWFTVTIPGRPSAKTLAYGRQHGVAVVDFCDKHEVILQGREAMDAFAAFRGITINWHPIDQWMMDLDTGEVIHGDTP